MTTEALRAHVVAAHRLLGRSPTSYKAHLYLGSASFVLGDLAQAAASYQAALDHIDRPNAWLYYQLARSLLGLGRRAEAVEPLRRCVELAPEFVEAAGMLRYLKSELSRLPQPSLTP